MEFFTILQFNLVFFKGGHEINLFVVVQQSLVQNGMRWGQWEGAGQIGIEQNRPE